MSKSDSRRNSKKSRKDPHQQREAARYDQPIASRELLLELLGEAHGPMDIEALAQQLNYVEDQALMALQRRLGAMVRDGQVFRNRREEYAVVSKADLIPGRVLGHKDGFGFVRPDAGGDDLFLPPKQMRVAMHGDHVLVRQSGVDHRGRSEAKLIEVLERAQQALPGIYFEESGIGFVMPQAKQITHEVLVPPGKAGAAKHGDIVVVSIDEYPSKRSHALGHISEILGHESTPDMHVEMAIRSFALPYEWKASITNELSALKETLPEAEVRRRRDVRDLPFVTIDGEDARDFDDAVYCESINKGWRLYVAIADVSWYVPFASALDEEAQERGTSVYFPNRVVPMLPEKLSNGLCSINPDVDRFCMLCEMEISHEGKLLKSSFHEAVMHSHARLTYTKVAAMLDDGDKSLRQQYKALLPHLQTLSDLHAVLAKARSRRGAIDFDSNETRFEFGEDGAIVDVVPVVRNRAHKMIEESMIIANIAAARYLEKKDMPALYRVHNGPELDDLDKLRQFLLSLGLTLGGNDKPQPRDYAKVLKQVKDRPDAHLIQTVMLRSLKQAVYTHVNDGHFGLALDAYAHFTSPIRRYPDLLVHRAIRHVLQKGNHKDYRYTQTQMERLGELCSTRERRADEASWDVIEALKCEFLQQHVEDEFDGVIVGVNNFGVFVELSGLDISGLVHVTQLGHDYFHLDEIHHRLIGEHTQIAFQLGETMAVRVIRVDVDERKIDLEPISLPEKLTQMRSGSGKRKGRSKGRGKGPKRRQHGRR